MTAPFSYPRPPRSETFTTTTGARGEKRATGGQRRPRPKGEGLRIVLEAMADIGFEDIPPTGFDAIDVPLEAGEDFTFLSRTQVRRWCDQFVFVEVKTCTQDRADGGFGKFLFTIPVSELRAAEILGDRFIMVLYNQNTGQTLETSAEALLARASSTNWVLQIQLAPTKKKWEGPTVFEMFPPPQPDALDMFMEAL